MAEPDVSRNPEPTDAKKTQAKSEEEKPSNPLDEADIDILKSYVRFEFHLVECNVSSFFSPG